MKFKTLSIITLLLLISLVYAQSVSIFNGASIKEIDLKQQSEVILNQGEIIRINDIDYPAKQGSKFVFNEKGELTTGSSFTTEQGTYNIKGFEIDLPEDSVVTYEENKVTIKLKKDSKLSVKETEKAQASGIFEFISERELEIDGIKINPLQDKETKVFYDTEKKLFYIKEAEINNFEIGKFESPETYLFSTEIPKDFNNPTLLIKDNTLVLKASSTQDSPDIIYKKDGAKAIMQALDGGQIEITTLEKRLDITTKGGYKIFNGKLLEKNGKIGKLSESFYDLIEPTEKTIPLRVVSFEKDGTPIKGETFYDNQGNFFVGYNKGDGIYTKANGEIYVENNELKTSYYGLSSEQNAKFQELSKTEKLEVLRGVAGGGSLGGILEGIRAISVPNLKTFSSQKYSNVVKGFERKGDVGYEVHEGIHFYVNTPLSTGDWSPLTGGQRAFWLGNGKYALVDKTGLIKGKIVTRQSRTNPSESDIFPGTGITKYIPLEMVGESNTANYFSSMFSSRDAIHTNEDSSTFQAETRALFNRQIASPDDDGSLNAVIEFMIYDGSEGVYVLDKKPGYFETPKGGQLQALIKTQTENSMKLFNEADKNPRLSSNYIKQNNYMDRWGPTMGVREKLILLRTSPSIKATNLRRFYINNYGSDWTQKTLGFKYADGSKN